MRSQEIVRVLADVNSRHLASRAFALHARLCKLAVLHTLEASALRFHEVSYRDVDERSEVLQAEVVVEKAFQNVFPRAPVDDIALDCCFFRFEFQLLTEKATEVGFGIYDRQAERLTVAREDDLYPGDGPLLY